ncbi:hypothetical protein GCM10010912_22250 [Paenibacillus albidus]|uniref:Uncharacterized protein n=1 Tax=Paenibacillus albidus TaxID=2041023 RepID=A0A917C956_9BACL|nr:hypothetical protein [Paenibacillus albidus]GGF76691.1 hypothetical protein GCM10010912_22250 [Paenibacillus albidus]
MNNAFILSFSVAVGSIVMLILNLIFFGSSIATTILGASTALNCAVLSTFYREESLETLKRMFGKR